MKTKILSLMALLVLTISLSACHDSVNVNPPTKQEQGQVNLRSMSVDVNNAEKVINSGRAQIDLSDFIIEIFNATGQRVGNYTYSQMPEILTLEAGDYKVSVRSHEVEKAAWETPYFVGEKDFTVTSENITDIGIVTCKLSNIKVSIRYSEGLLKYMGDDCKVTVMANDEGRLEFTKDEKRSGYFAAVEGSSTLVAEFTGTVGGYKETVRHICSDVEPGQHRIITFTLRGPNGEVIGEEGQIDPNGGINIDASVEDEDLNGNINSDEDNLGDDDRPGSDEQPDDGDDPTPPTPPTPGDEDAITFVSDGADFDKVNTPSDHVVVTISSKNGIEHLNVKIMTDNNNFAASVADLLPMEFDLAYPGENQAKFASVGFPTGNEVIGQKEIIFDISTFVPLLNAFSGTHSFQISVTDSESIQLVKTLTFKVN